MTFSPDNVPTIDLPLFDLCTIFQRKLHLMVVDKELSETIKRKHEDEPTTSANEPTSRSERASKRLRFIHDIAKHCVMSCNEGRYTGQKPCRQKPDIACHPPKALCSLRYDSD